MTAPGPAAAVVDKEQGSALAQLVARVADEQLRVAWIARDPEHLRAIVRWLRATLEHAGDGHRVLVSKGIETYRHTTGGRIIFVTPRSGRLRGQSIEEIHDHSAPTTWSARFAADIVVLRASGADLR